MSCDLLCVEKGEESMPLAPFDPAMISDPRVLLNLLRLEPNSIPKCDYFRNGVQPELEPKMRKVLTTWMLEVCEEQHCEPQVFPLAVNLLDRYLACNKVHRSHLQLLACVCLLSATKLRQCRALGVELLVYYTDYSVKAEEIRQWEKLVLTKLGWDIASVTAYDFVDPLLEQIPSCRRTRPERTRRNKAKDSATPAAPVPEEPVSPLRGDSSVTEREARINEIRSYALTFVASSCTEYEFMQATPSLLAAACITLAITVLKMGRPSHVLDMMVDATRVDRMRLCAVLQSLDAVMNMQFAELKGHASHQYKSAPISSTGTSKQQAQVLDADGNPETPTDVQDIVF